MMIRRMALFTELICMMGSISAHAACAGSGTTWTCPAGASVADVQNAVNAASDGAVITLAAGTYNSWGASGGGGGTILMPLGKGLTLICATPPLTVGAATTNPCTINSKGGTVFGTSYYPSGTDNKVRRISGFTVNENGFGNIIFTGQSCNPCNNGVFSQIRIDHNTFTTIGDGTVAIFFGGNGTGTYVYGVADHNIMNSPSDDGFVFEINAFPDPSPPVVSPQGTASNFFVEDNVITYGLINGSTAGEAVSDSWGNAGIVWRHNTVTNGLFSSHAVDHGGGASNIEVYNNTFTMNSGATDGFETCYRCIHHQGANEFIVFNNTFTPRPGAGKGTPIDLGSYRDYAYGDNGPGNGGYSIDSSMLPCDGTDTSDGDGNRAPTAIWYGYPCWHQPGRDTSGNYHPVYEWNDQWNDGTQASLNLENFGGTAPLSCVAHSSATNNGTCQYFTKHVISNRDAYNSVSASAQTSPASPFNGTTGMGFGTLANRPATCTTSTETAYGKGAAGVGYFATDVGDQGTLYTCSATNTWMVYYTPYTYPHPLVAGGNTQSQAPTAPDGLQATVN